MQSTVCVTKVHAIDLGRPHETALQAAETLLVKNAHINVTDVYTLAAPVGHGAFAKVVECTQKVFAAEASIHDASTAATHTCWKPVRLLNCVFRRFGAYCNTFTVKY